MQEVKIAGVTYDEFTKEVKRIAQEIQGRKFVYAAGESKYQQAVMICAALSKEIPVIPLCSDYGKERNKKIMEQVERAKIPKDVAAILFTSGTEGTPKGVMLTKKAIINNLDGISKYMGESRRSILIFRPLVHSAVYTGELLYALKNKWDINFWDKIFSPIELADFMEKRGATIAGMTPTVLNSFLRMKTRPPLKEIILSGERLYQTAALKFAKEMPDCKFYSVYGLTENSPRVSALTPKDFVIKKGSVGKPISKTKVKIVNGELWVKSKSRMKGYLGQRKLTRSKFHRGWLKTGDCARIDRDGDIYILGREDDMIIRSGMNIYPAEVEGPMSLMDGIDECVAYGEYDANHGQKIIFEYTGTADEQRVAAYAAMYLPAYLIPSVFHKREQLQKTESGKIKR